MVPNLRLIRTGEEKILREMLSEVPSLSIHPESPLIIGSDWEKSISYSDGRTNRQEIGYLAENAQGEVVAAIGYGQFSTPEQGLLPLCSPQLRLFVKSSYQGKGIGTFVLEQFLEKIRRKGYRQVSLSVNRSNRSIYMFARMGFEIVNESGNWLIMRKQFDPSPVNLALAG